MLAFDLELFSLQANVEAFAKCKLIEQYEEELLTFFTTTIGLNNMTASHYAVLESLHELIKNSLDAGATQLFIKDNSSSRASICVMDNGDGFSRDFFATDTSHLDYGEKLGGLLAINSTKKGEHKLGGHGRGLAQAYEVLKQYEGSILCSNRVEEEPGAHIEFYSSLAPVSASDIRDLFNCGRQRFSSRYCQFHSAEEEEQLVQQMFRFFPLPKQAKSVSQASDKKPDLTGESLAVKSEF